jgi:hypothetical protein
VPRLGGFGICTFLRRLHPTVAHIAVSLMDRALCYTVPVSKLKLLGASYLVLGLIGRPEATVRRGVLDAGSITGT